MCYLVVSVGGSPAPIIHSIRHYNPHFVEFLCSADGQGRPGSYATVDGQGRDTVVAETGLSEGTYRVETIEDFDNPFQCYRKALESLSRLRSEHPRDVIYADYTGGTKSMSVGLVLASLEVPDVKLTVIHGERTDLVKVQEGTQRARLVGTSQLLVERQLSRLGSLFRSFDYAAVTSGLEELSRYEGLDWEQHQRIQTALTLARGLEAWDAFDHERAWGILSRHRKHYTDLVMFLDAVVHSRKRVDEEWGRRLQGLSNGTLGHGMELVDDQLLNAQRRAAQGRFDDATARLYRGLELIGQMRLLLAFSIRTGEVELEKLPPELRDEYAQQHSRNGKVQVALMAGFQLLEELGDPVGKLFTERKQKILRALEVRNNSILAHGFRPVSKADYDQTWPIVDEFWQNVGEILASEKRVRVRPMQFPQESPC